MIKISEENLEHKIENSGRESGTASTKSRRTSVEQGNPKKKMKDELENSRKNIKKKSDDLEFRKSIIHFMLLIMYIFVHTMHY